MWWLTQLPSLPPAQPTPSYRLPPVAMTTMKAQRTGFNTLHNWGLFLFDWVSDWVGDPIKKEKDRKEKIKGSWPGTCIQYTRLHDYALVLCCSVKTSVPFNNQCLWVLFYNCFFLSFLTHKQITHNMYTYIIYRERISIWLFKHNFLITMSSLEHM